MQADLASDIVTRTVAMRRSIAYQHAFVAELAVDPLTDAATSTFGALAGRDVVVLFVESCGRSFIDGERFRGPRSIGRTNPCLRDGATMPDPGG